MDELRVDARLIEECIEWVNVYQKLCQALGVQYQRLLIPWQHSRLNRSLFLNESLREIPRYFVCEVKEKDPEKIALIVRDQDSFVNETLFTLDSSPRLLPVSGFIIFDTICSISICCSDIIHLYI